MKYGTRNKVRQILIKVILVVVSILILSPFYVAICYAFKSRTEFAKTKLANSTSTQSGAFFFSAYFPAKSIIHVPKDDRSNDLLFL